AHIRPEVKKREDKGNCPGVIHNERQRGSITQQVHRLLDQVESASTDFGTRPPGYGLSQEPRHRMSSLNESGSRTRISTNRKQKHRAIERMHTNRTTRLSRARRCRNIVPPDVRSRKHAAQTARSSCSVTHSRQKDRLHSRNRATAS